MTPSSRWSGRLQHRLAHHHDLMDLIGMDLPARDLDRRLDHGEDEAFDAIAEEGEIALLRHMQASHDLAMRGIALENGDEPRLGLDEQAFRVPERVVGIEGDGRDHSVFLVGVSA